MGLHLFVIANQLAEVSILGIPGGVGVSLHNGVGVFP